MVRTKKKPKIGVFGFTGCGGCQLIFFNLKDDLLKLLEKVDIENFRWIKEWNKEGPFDIAFVEGGISTKEEWEKIKEIRSKSKFLVAIGTCAMTGCVAAIRNFLDMEKMKKEIYGDEFLLDIMDVTPIDEHVKVDYYLRGCPIDKDELLELIECVINGRIPEPNNYSVCIECKRNQNSCFLKKGIVCLGPITHAGCNSVCVNNGFPCFGCRGPLDEANVPVIKKLFKDLGLNDEEVRKKLIEFVGKAKIVEPEVR